MAAVVSVVIFMVSLLGLAWNGLKWGLDFTGGVQITLTYPTKAANLMTFVIAYHMGLPEKHKY